jgi:hypothetical protein
MIDFAKEQLRRQVTPNFATQTARYGDGLERKLAHA